MRGRKDSNGLRCVEAGDDRRRKALGLFLSGVFLLSVAILPGDLGSVDTARRLNVTHSLWTDAPPVPVEDRRDFGIPGRNGEWQVWYGIGQSLLMLPADVLATSLLEIAGGGDPQMRAGLVSVLTFPALSVLGAWLAFLVLEGAGLRWEMAIPGAILFSLATSFLPHSQINQENSLETVALLGALAFALRWRRTGRLRHSLVSGVFASIGILTRLTHLADVPLMLCAGAAAAAGSLRKPEGMEHGGTSSRGWKSLLPFFLAPAAAIVLDRAYHIARFGEIGSTYIGIWGRYVRQANPSLSPSFPFDQPFLAGFSGAFFSPAYSVFWTDPLLLLVPLVMFAPGRTGWLFRAVVLFGLGHLLVLAAFYARYFDWPGQAGWGNRFLASSAQIVALGALGAWLSGAKAAGRLARAAAFLIVGSGLVVNLSATVFWYQLEATQISSLGAHAPMPGLRLFNIAGAVSGRFEKWGLATPGVSPRMRTPNFGAILAARRGQVSVVLGATIVVGLLSFASCALLGAVTLARTARRGEGRRTLGALSSSRESL